MASSTAIEAHFWRRSYDSDISMFSLPITLPFHSFICSLHYVCLKSFYNLLLTLKITWNTTKMENFGNFLIFLYFLVFFSGIHHSKTVVKSLNSSKSHELMYFWRNFSKITSNKTKILNIANLPPFSHFFVFFSVINHI